MRKLYTSRSIPHFAVGSKRIAFISKAAGGSYYITDDEALQARLERHPWYGKKYVLSKQYETAMSSEVASSSVSSSSVKSLEEVKFSVLSDAKEWLARRFGVTRSSIRSREAAISAGEKNGVKIVFE